jgi:hypothetical protein
VAIGWAAAVLVLVGAVAAVIWTFGQSLWLGLAVLALVLFFFSRFWILFSVYRSPFYSYSDG